MFRHRNEYRVEAQLPGFDGATAWLNGAPVTPAELRGRVVLVSFGTYTCINWIHSLPYVRAWADTYGSGGLVVSACRRPSSSSRATSTTSRRAIEEMDVRYPVVVDNDYAIWRAFDNHYWPALYFVDAEGRIRHHHFGEGGYEESEMVLQMLLQRSRWRHRSGLRARRAPRRRGGRRLDQPRLTGDLRRLRPRRRLRLTRRRRAGRPPRLLGTGRVAPQPVGAVG